MFDWEGWKMLNIFTQKLNVMSPNTDKKGPVQLLAQTISRGGECEGCNPFQSVNNKSYWLSQPSTSALLLP